MGEGGVPTNPSPPAPTGVVEGLGGGGLQATRGWQGKGCDHVGDAIVWTKRGGDKVDGARFNLRLSCLLRKK